MMKTSRLLLRLKRRFRSTGKRGSPTHPNQNSPFGVDWLKAGLVVFTIAVLSVLMSIHLLPGKVSLNINDTSDRDIKAGRSVTWIDSQATEQARQVEMLATRPVYDTDENAAHNATHTLQEFFDRLESERAHVARHLRTRPEAVTQSVAALQSQFGSIFTAGQLNYLLTCAPATFQKLRDTTRRLTAEIMADRDIRDLADLRRPAKDLEDARQDLLRSARTQLNSDREAAIVSAVANQALRPNRLLNRVRTLAHREEAGRGVRPRYDHIAQGDIIVRAGDTVTQTHLDKLAALGVLDPYMELTTGIAVCVLAAAMVLLVAFFIRYTLPRLYADRKRLALLSVIVLLSVFGLKLGASLLGLEFSSGQLGYLGMMSVAAAGMLVTVLLNRNLAVVIVAMLSVQSGLIMNHEIRYTVMTLMSSLVGILSVSGVRSKTNLLTTTAALAGANLALVWLMGLLLRDSWRELATGSAWAAGSAAFATFLFWFGVLVLERPFGILTHTGLLELSGTDRPLLKQLCAVAPGTYAHSMMVGVLAEAGAQAIGADALLCRVGGYYHDIGKMKRPEFFVENQRRENVHGRLSPSLSALIITAHVRDGLELAAEHKLPTEIRDIIAQHHGTTLIQYFYHQAVTDVGSEDAIPPGLEERFRYPGPKPQTRESAIVMLADSVEAAARCLERPDRERLEALIHTITQGKIEDGQLDECELTFKDAHGICEAFLQVLSAMMHGRIDYPKPLPRTASGRPMEVVRADLRPEAPQLTLPATGLRPGLSSGELPLDEERMGTETVDRVDQKLSPDSPMDYALGAVGLNFGHDNPETEGESLSSAMYMEVPKTSDSASGGPEAVHGRYPGERASAPHSDDHTASGGSPPPSRRKHGARGGEHSSHG